MIVNGEEYFSVDFDTVTIAADYPTWSCVGLIEMPQKGIDMVLGPAKFGLASGNDRVYWDNVNAGVPGAEGNEVQVAIHPESDQYELSFDENGNFVVEANKDGSAGFTAVVADVMDGMLIDFSANPVISVTMKTTEAFNFQIGPKPASAEGNPYGIPDLGADPNVEAGDVFNTYTWDYSATAMTADEAKEINKIYLNFNPHWDAALSPFMGTVTISEFLVGSTSVIPHIGYSPKNVVIGEATTADDISAIIVTMWDDANIYIDVDITDDLLDNAATNSWERDQVEVYFDMDNSKQDVDNGFDDNDRQIAFLWNTDNTGVLDGAAISEQMDTENGWHLDIMVPFSALMDGFVPAEGTVIGFDVHVADNDGADTRDTKLSWMAVADEAWHNASYMGELRLLADGRTEPIMPVASSDATVSDITWDGTTIPDFVAGDLDEEYMIEISPEDTADLISSVVITPNDPNASVVITAQRLDAEEDYGEYVIDFKVVAQDGTEVESILVFWYEVVGISKSDASFYSVYPNPMENRLTISNSENIQRIEIVNVVGRKVIVVENESMSTIKINTADIESGIYLLNLYSKDGSKTVKRIIKR